MFAVVAIGAVADECVVVNAAVLNVATDDCRRVFTTSRGHVAIAPIVPPTLYIKTTNSLF